MKKNLILLITLGILFSLVQTADSLPVCTKTEVCAEQKSCSSTSDGICPVLYGDWSGCRPNPEAYSSRCNVCDPDCINQEIILSETLQGCGSINFVNFPVNCKIDDPLTITVETSLPNTQISLTKVDPSLGNPIVGTKTCTGTPCQAVFTVADNSQLKCPSTPGTNYNYNAKITANPNNNIYGTGISYPLVKITEPAILPSETKASVSGQVTITATAESNQGIDSMEFFLKKGSLLISASSCNQCTEDGCNKIGEPIVIPGSPSTTQSTTWNSEICENGDYTIIARAYDSPTIYAEDSITATTDNAACIGPSCIFVSDIVQIIKTKVKTWV